MKTTQKILIMIVSFILLTACSNDDEDTNQYSFGSLTVANFPIGWYGVPKEDGSGVYPYSGIHFGIQDNNGKLFADVWDGIDNKGNPHFNDVSIDKNIITVENNMFIIKFRFDEYPDRYEVTFIWGESKPEYEYKYYLHFTQERNKYYKLK